MLRFLNGALGKEQLDWFWPRAGASDLNHIEVEKPNTSLSISGRQDPPAVVAVCVQTRRLLDWTIEPSFLPKNHRAG